MEVNLIHLDGLQTIENHSVLPARHCHFGFLCSLPPLSCSTDVHGSAQYVKMWVCMSEWVRGCRGNGEGGWGGGGGVCVCERGRVCVCEGERERVRKRKKERKSARLSE